MRAIAMLGKASTVLLCAGIIFSGCSGNKKDSKGKDRNKGPLEVNGTIVKISSLENDVTINGSLMPNEQVELKAEAQGKIVALNLNEGTTVTKGMLLAKLNDSDLQATLKRLKAQESQASADEKRKKELLAINGISLQDYEQSKTSLEALRADIQMTNAQIAKTEIRAPFSGTVGLRSVSLGAFVNQTTVIAKLIQTNPLKIEFNLPERYAMVIKKDGSVTFTIEGDNVDYKAKIYAIEPDIDPLSRTVKVRGYASNTKNNLIPGSYIKVNVPLHGGATKLLPAETIVPQLGSQNVYLVKEGKAVLTTIKTGFRTGTQVEIINGISVGDTVITTGLMMLKDGMPVKVTSVE